jgi:hypothetical protein
MRSRPLAARPRRCSSAQALFAHPARRLAAKGERNQVIGRSRGGRTTKIHALTDQLCRPIAFTLTGGQVPDCVAAKILLPMAPPET